MAAASLRQNTQTRASQRPRQVHTITDRFSMANTYLIDDGQFIVVDPGSAVNIHLLQAYIERFLQRTPSDIDLILLTQLHADYTAGIEALQRICTAPVAAFALTTQEPPRSPSASVIAPPMHQKSASRDADNLPPYYARQIEMVNIWLKHAAGLPRHPDWHIIASAEPIRESLYLYNAFTYELLCGEAVTTLEMGVPFMRGRASRREIVETLRMLRSLNVYYLYPAHGRPVLAQRAVERIQAEW